MLGQGRMFRYQAEQGIVSPLLLGTVLIGEEVEVYGKPLDFNPCLERKLFVAACPVGAIKPDSYFDFSTRLAHNYQPSMGGFVKFVEDIASSRSVQDYRGKQSYAETLTDIAWAETRVALDLIPVPTTTLTGIARLKDQD